MREIILRTLVTGLLLAMSFGCDNRTTKEKPKHVVVLKFATHPALDELEGNFVDELSRIDAKIRVTRLNANGDPSSAKQLAESASRKGTDLIVSLATPATQAVSNTPSEITFLYAAVADPKGAGVESERSTGIRNAGRPIIETAITKIKELNPSISRIGTIYNPAEQNSIYVQGILKDVCENNGMVLISRTVSDPTHLGPAAEQMRPNIDILYCTNDNTVNKGAQSLAETCKALKLPFVIGELSAVEKGPLLGVGVEYSAMGKRLATLAMEILNQATGVRKLPIPEGPPTPELWLNSKTAAEIGFVFPESILEGAAKNIQ